MPSEHQDAPVVSAVNRLRGQRPKPKRIHLPVQPDTFVTQPSYSDSPAELHAAREFLKKLELCEPLHIFAACEGLSSSQTRTVSQISNPGDTAMFTKTSIALALIVAITS